MAEKMVIEAKMRDRPTERLTPDKGVLLPSSVADAVESVDATFTSTQNPLASGGKKRKLQTQLKLAEIASNTTAPKPVPMSSGKQISSIEPESNLHLLYEPLTYALDVFEKLIIPNIHSPEGSISIDCIRKSLYRRLFTDYVIKHLAEYSKQILCIEDLVPIIVASIEKSGIVLL